MPLIEDFVYIVSKAKPKQGAKLNSVCLLYGKKKINNYCL